MKHLLLYNYMMPLEIKYKQNYFHTGNIGLYFMRRPMKNDTTAIDEYTNMYKYHEQLYEQKSSKHPS